MKNILARGGIEFIAVLLGLTGSLWIDSIVKENEAIKQNDEILNRLYTNLKADSSDGAWNQKAYERAIKGSKNVIKWCDLNPNFSMVNDSIEKDISAMLIATFFGQNDEEYNSLKNSGKMHLIKNKTLIGDLHSYNSHLDWSDFMDRETWKYTYEEIVPFLSNYGNELHLYREREWYKKNKVFAIYPKINLTKLPNIEKLRFYASHKLWFHEHQVREYKSIVKVVSNLRALLRKELDIK
jgi:hypothetical protein